MVQQNNNFFPWEDVQEDNVFPTGCFHVVIEDMEDGTAASSGKRMFRVRYGCKAPGEFVGMSHFENYVTGTEENPTGINAGTMGARGLKKMLKAAQVPPSNDIAALCLSAKGAELMLSLNHFVEKDGPYAGTPRNRIADYHRLGEREAKVASGGAPGQQRAATAPMSAPPIQNAPPIMQAAPVQAQQFAPIQSAPPVQQPVAPPVAQPAPQAWPQAQPVQQPVQAAPQMAPAAPPAGPVNEPMLRCTICQQEVPVSQFGNHIQGHTQGR